MASFVDQTTSPHLANFIHAVGKLVPTVLDRDLGIAPRQIATIDVGDARHEMLIDSERFELAMEGGSFHADEFGGP